MRILTVGGGSGGHVTPVVAVLGEIRKKYPRARVRFWCDKHFAGQARTIFAESDKSVQVQTVVAGKFRRYHHLSKLQHVFIPSIIFPNLRDLFLVIFGVGQSVVRLMMWRPDVVFAKGGYVCLPVGVAAWLLRIPVVIHDSDVVPGLTNRLLAPFAKKIATGMPLDYYSYPPNKSVYVGTPIDSSFRVLSEKRRENIKQELGFDTERPLLVVVGGGQGSRQINDAIARNLSKLLERTNVMLVSGTEQFVELRSLTPQEDKRFILRDFISSGMSDVLGAADVVITRAGATSLLELAAVARPIIVVPSKRLVWQVKHAEPYIQSGAALPLDEDMFEEPNDRSLVRAVFKVLDDKKLRDSLSENLHRHARPHAARDMAALILDTAKRS